MLNDYAEMAPTRTVEMFSKIRFWLTQKIWVIQKWRDRHRKWNPDEVNEILKAAEKVEATFRAIGIDVDSKPIEQQRLYNMMLIYIDEAEFLMPSAARTANMIGLLEYFGAWTLPPTSVAVSPEFAKEIDGYVAMELFRNNQGLADIHQEITSAIASAEKALKS